MNQDSSPNQLSPTSGPQTVQVRVQPKALVGGVVAVMVLIGIGFKIGAGSAAESTGELTTNTVVENEEPTIDEDIPALDPESGPAIAPTPTTLAETPLPLDPVVTTIAEVESEPPTTDQSVVLETDGVLVVEIDDSSTIELPLPKGWVDTGEGNATGENGTMRMYVASTTSDTPTVVNKYQAKVLPNYFVDLKFSDFKNLNSSAYSTIGYFSYEGVDIKDGATRFFGFVWVGTTTSGNTWLVDVWGLYEIPDDTFNTYFNFTAGWFDNYFAA